MPVVVDAVEIVTETLPLAGAQLAALRGVEAVSRPYRFDLTLLVPRAEADDLAARALGERVSFHLRLGPGSERTLHGVIDRATSEPGGAHDRDRLHVRVVPELALLRHGRQSRLFQDQTAIEVVQAVLAERRVPVRASLSGDHARRDLCTQYLESDLELVHRLLAEEGVFYYFEEGEDGRERVVLCDDADATQPIEGRAELTHRTVSGLSDTRDDVLGFSRRRTTLANAVTLREFDFERPSLDLHAQTRAEGATPGGLEIYEHHGQHGGLDVHPRAATRRLEQARTRAEVGDGTSRCPRLSAGRAFQLAGAPLLAHDGVYTLLRVEHRARMPESDASVELVYENRFTCIPRSVAPRPKARRRKLHESLVTATVVGPAQQEIHTDPHGRIRVEFHWDRRGHKDERSSCWIRVAQTWAGVGWGSQFIPRIGMEVLVAFVGGDPDRPLVVSAVPNAEHPLPFPLPAQKTKSGLRTQSSRGGGGFHELSFEDRAGYERIYLRSQRDLEEEVLNDRFTTIGGSAVTRIAGTSTTEVAETAIGLVTGDRVSSVGGDDVVTVGGASRLTVDGASSTEIAGSAHLTVRGDAERRATGQLTETVGGRARRAVGRDDDVRIGGSRSAIIGGSDATSIGGDAQTDVDGGLYASARKGLIATVGDGAHATRVDVSGDGELEVRASKLVRIEAKETLILKVGKTEVILDEAGLRLLGKRVEAAGDEVALISEKASLSLGAELRGAAEKVTLASAAKASLSLGTDAELDGANVHLNRARAVERELAKARKAEEPKVDKAKLWLFDRAGRRCEGGPYEVSLPGWTAQGTAPGGFVEVPRFSGVDRVTLRWGRKLDEREPHERTPELEFSAQIFLDTDVDDPDERARRKLANLGHTATDLRAAVAAFQAHKGLDVTGDVSATLGAIDDQHATKTPAKTPA